MAAGSERGANRVLVSGKRAPLGRGDVKAVVRAVLQSEGVAAAEVSVLFTDDEEIRGLNKKYRKQDKATDVLSFEMDDEVMLGDIVISVDKVKAQALACGVTPAEETARLLVHGTLHLLGYDHDGGGKEATRMKRKEEEVLKGLKPQVS